MERHQMERLMYLDKVDIPTNAGQRAIADIIEYQLVEDLVSKGGRKPSSVRTIEDVMYKDKYIDIKTRDIDREFSMPNLISVDRLMKNKDKHIEYKLVDYQVRDNIAYIVHMEDRPIWTICWSAMKIQNLGLGQLQLVKTSDIPYYKGTKEEWFIELRTQMNAFYKRQIIKFEKLINE